MYLSHNQYYNEYQPILVRCDIQISGVRKKRKRLCVFANLIFEVHKSEKINAVVEPASD